MHFPAYLFKTSRWEAKEMNEAASSDVSFTRRAMRAELLDWQRTMQRILKWQISFHALRSASKNLNVSHRRMTGEVFG